MKLADFFESVFLFENLNVSPGCAMTYRIAIRAMEKFHRVDLSQGLPDPNRRLLLSDLNRDQMLRFIRHLQAQGENSERTINNKRAAVLTVWKFARSKNLAADPGRIQKLKLPRRIVQAWTLEEVARILEWCEFAPKLDGWDGRHWKALVLVIYDTSHRIGCLMRTKRTALNSEGLLLMLAELSKHNADTLHKLHPQTLEALAALPPSKSDLLFPWPLSFKELFPRFKEILRAAGLSATRKDLFHKLRRTSFTYVFALLGKPAAQEHAAHSSDVTSSYLDLDLLKRLNHVVTPIDVLPRPNPR